MKSHAHLLLTMLALFAATLVLWPVTAMAADLTPKEQLGKLIFFDESLSTPDGMSCGTCHDPAAGFADPRPDFPVSQGIVPDRFGNRNANSITYAAYNGMLMFMPNMGPMNMGVWQGGQFWDGRSSTLLEQAKLPFVNPLEMNNPNAAAVIRDVRTSSYADLFRQVYGATSLDQSRRQHKKAVADAFDCVADAIAAYESSVEVNPFSSKYDAYLRGEALLTEQEAAGLVAYQKACNRCHANGLTATGVPNGTVPIFSSHHHANTGVPKNPDNPYYDIAPEFNPLGHDYVDLGTGEAVADPFHYGRFKIPSLRNVALTAPYMHNGVFATLHEVVDFYNTRDVPEAGWPAPEWAENIIVGPEKLGNIGLTDQQVDDVVAYLGTLTDGYVADEVSPRLSTSLATTVATKVNARRGPGGGSGGTGGQLSVAEVSWLIHMREEEKLARDVYLTMYDRWAASIFGNISTSEQRHMDAVESLIDKYGLTDPVTDEAARGGFKDAGLSALYGELIARGLGSLREAYEVGVDIEVLDIADLRTAIKESSRTDIDTVYGNLLAASQNHLSAFSSKL